MFTCSIEIPVISGCNRLYRLRSILLARSYNARASRFSPRLLTIHSVFTPPCQRWGYQCISVRVVMPGTQPPHTSMSLRSFKFGVVSAKVVELHIKLTSLLVLSLQPNSEWILSG